MKNTRKNGMMIRRTVKAGLVALSLTATLGTWAILARNDGQSAPSPSEPVVQSLDLPPIPTVARPPVAGEPLLANARPKAARDLLPIPIARTRSSR